MLLSSSPSFEGPYKDLLIEYLRARELRGYECEHYRYHLSSLNSFLVSERGHDSVAVTAEDVDEWVTLAPTKGGRESRFSVIDMFCAFLQSKGYDGIARMNRRCYMAAPEFRARILEDAELASFFAACDSIGEDRPRLVYDHAKLFPLLARLLYGCGLRISEGLGLKVGDIDFDTGAMRILDSKNGDSRIVYASDSLMASVERYMAAIRAVDGDGYLLRGVDGRMYHVAAAHRMMRAVSEAAGLEGDGQQSLRPHDLRHNFAVRAMEKMADEGYDLYAAIPYLCKYMGHRDVRDTEYYIQLVPRGYARITDRMERFAPDVVPDLGGGLRWA